MQTLLATRQPNMSRASNITRNETSHTLQYRVFFAYFFVFLYMKLQQGNVLPLWYDNCTGHIFLYTGHPGHMRVSFLPFVAKILQQSNCQDMVKVLIRPPGIFPRNFLLRTISGSARCCSANISFEISFLS